MATRLLCPSEAREAFLSFSNRDYEIEHLGTRRLSPKEQIDAINERNRKRREQQEQTPELDSAGLSVSALWPLLADEASPGLAGDIVNSIDPYAEADRVSVLLNVLTGFGSCLNAGPYAVVGKDRCTLSTLYATEQKHG